MERKDTQRSSDTQSNNISWQKKSPRNSAILGETQRNHRDAKIRKGEVIRRAIIYRSKKNLRKTQRFLAKLSVTTGTQGYAEEQ